MEKKRIQQCAFVKWFQKRERERDFKKRILKEKELQL